MTSVQPQPSSTDRDATTNLHDVNTVSNLLKDVEEQLKQTYKDYAINEKQLTHYQTIFTDLARNERKRLFPDDHPDQPDQDSDQPPLSKQKVSTVEKQDLLDQIKNLKQNLKDERKQKTELASVLEKRTRAMNTDAKELQTLRSENTSLQDAKRKIIALEADLHATEMRTDREVKESQHRVTIETEKTGILQAEVGRLSAELTKVRCDNEIINKENVTALKNVTELSKTYSKELAQTKVQNKQMEEYIKKIEDELAALKQESGQDKKSFEEERSRLTKLNQLQKDLTKEAEQRASDFQEILKSVQEEIQSKETEQKQQSPGLGRHAEVLLENMQKTLDSRINLLHGQKKEMERAQASEMKLMAKQENLIRLSQNAQWEAEEARKEVTRLETMLNEQNRVVTDLEGRLSSAASPNPLSIRAVRESLGQNSMVDPEIGPRSVIPIDYPKSRFSSEWTAEASGAIDELEEIRKRHQRLLENIRNRRASQI